MAIKSSQSMATLEDLIPFPQPIHDQSNPNQTIQCPIPGQSLTNWQIHGQYLTIKQSLNAFSSNWPIPSNPTPIQYQSIRTSRTDLRELVLYRPTTLDTAWLPSSRTVICPSLCHLSILSIDCPSTANPPRSCHSVNSVSIQCQSYANRRTIP